MGPTSVWFLLCHFRFRVEAEDETLNPRNDSRRQCGERQRYLSIVWFGAIYEMAAEDLLPRQEEEWQVLQAVYMEDAVDLRKQVAWQVHCHWGTSNYRNHQILPKSPYFYRNHPRYYRNHHQIF